MVANTDSKNLVKTSKRINSLYLNRDIKISDDDTLLISPFARAVNNNKLCGFFVENLNTGLDSEIAIPIDEDKNHDGDYETLEYVGKYIGAVLKNSGYKNVKVLVDIIMDVDECHKYIYACDMLGDENLAINYIFKSPIEMDKNKLIDTDALICFRPNDFSKIINNLDIVKEKLEKGNGIIGFYLYRKL